MEMKILATKNLTKRKKSLVCRKNRIVKSAESRNFLYFKCTECVTLSLVFCNYLLFLLWSSVNMTETCTKGKILKFK